MSAETRDQFAKWLKATRVAAGLSQREVAEAVASDGFRWLQSKIAKIEGGELIPRLDEAVALVNVFGATLDAALGLSAVSPQVIVSRQAAARRLVLLQQIAAAIEAEMGGVS